MALEKLRQAVDASGFSQKEVAAWIVDTLERAKEPVKLATVESKLSKLLAGDAEGRRFFEGENRRCALAHALGITEGELARELDKTTVILDPRLPSEVPEALKRQAEAATANVMFLATRVTHGSRRENHERLEPGRVLERYPSQDDGLQLELHDLSDKHPDALVVLAVEEDGTWYAERKRKATFAVKVPYGIALEGHEELLPVPPAKAPRTWQGEYPRVTNPTLVRDLRTELAAWSREEGRHSPQWRRDDSPNVAGFDRSTNLARLRTDLDNADDTGEEPSFLLLDVLDWLQATLGSHLSLPAHPSSHGAPKLRLRLEDVRGNLNTTHVWWQGGRLFATGPAAASFASLLAPHHTVVVDPNVLSTWRSALQTLNPFGTAFQVLTERAEQDVHIALADALTQRQQELARDRSWSDAEAPTPEIEKEARDALLTLARMPMRWENRTMMLPELFRLASESPLVHYPRGAFCVAHAAANLGAGRVAIFRVLRFDAPDDAPETNSPMEVVYSDRWAPSERGGDAPCLLATLSGSNLRAWVHTAYDENLEGWGSVPRPRALT